MYSWASIGDSNYNGGQLVLRHAMSHGMQMELSYTFSKSLDMGSDDERTVYSSSTGSSVGSSFSAILNAWNPQSELRAPPTSTSVTWLPRSWVADLPFGKGKWSASHSSTWMDRVIGGWQLSGVGPLDQRTSFQRDQRRGLGNQLAGEKQHDPDRAHPDRHATSAPMALPTSFANPAQALAELQNPYPGEAGQRNNFRGDGYFGIDARLAKNWKAERAHRPAICLGCLQRHQLGALRCESAELAAEPDHQRLLRRLRCDPDHAAGAAAFSALFLLASREAACHLWCYPDLSLDNYRGNAAGCWWKSGQACTRCRSIPVSGPRREFFSSTA